MIRFEWSMLIEFVFFFFQAEDGIRDYKVTGVQTCALPICFAGLGDAVDGIGGGVRVFGAMPRPAAHFQDRRVEFEALRVAMGGGGRAEIGRASCRERV